MQLYEIIETRRQLYLIMECALEVCHFKTVPQTNPVGAQEVSLQRAVVRNFPRLDASGRYASGGELFDYIVARGRVPEPEACNPCRSVALPASCLEKRLQPSCVSSVARVWPNRHAASSIKSSLVSRRPWHSTWGHIEWCSWVQFASSRVSSLPPHRALALDPTHKNDPVERGSRHEYRASGPQAAHSDFVRVRGFSLRHRVNASRMRFGASR